MNNAKHGSAAARPLRLVRIEEGAAKPEPAVVCRVVERLHDFRDATGVTPRMALHADGTWSLSLRYRTGLVAHPVRHAALDVVLAFLDGWLGSERGRPPLVAGEFPV